ncbi:hypothetical protein [Caproicibacter sp.]|uniref:hypothetical protein n=1 Tax=Caproicibacter sp. TaxID=2814884 RepID=UPI003989EB1B
MKKYFSHDLSMSVFLLVMVGFAVYLSVTCANMKSWGKIDYSAGEAEYGSNRPYKVQECTREDYAAMKDAYRGGSYGADTQRIHLWIDGKNLPQTQDLSESDAESNDSWNSKYYFVEEKILLDYKFALDFQAYVHALAGKDGRVQKIVEIAAPYLSMGGNASGSRFTGAGGLMNGKDGAEMDFNGVMSFEADNTVPVFGENYSQIAAGTDAGTKYQYLVRNERFRWSWSDLSPSGQA